MSRHCQLTGVFDVTHDVPAARDTFLTRVLTFPLSWILWGMVQNNPYFMLLCCRSMHCHIGAGTCRKAFLSGIIHLLSRGHVHAWGRPFLFLAFNHQHELGLGLGNTGNGQRHICLGYGAMWGRFVFFFLSSIRKQTGWDGGRGVWSEWLGVLLFRFLIHSRGCLAMISSW